MRADESVLLFPNLFYVNDFVLFIVGQLSNKRDGAYPSGVEKTQRNNNIILLYNIGVIVIIIFMIIGVKVRESKKKNIRLTVCI